MYFPDIFQIQSIWVTKYCFTTCFFQHGLFFKLLTKFLKPRLCHSLFLYLFLYLWLCWVFVSVQGLSPVVASGGHSSSRCAGLSPSRPLLLRSTGSRRAGSIIAAHGPSCPTACGIFPDQGSNPCPLHWQADSQPLRHQGSPCHSLIWPILKRSYDKSALKFMATILKNVLPSKPRRFP